MKWGKLDGKDSPGPFLARSFGETVILLDIHTTRRKVINLVYIYLYIKVSVALHVISFIE